jgi:signal transduction histidine kinase
MQFVGPAPAPGTHYSWQEILIVVPVMLEAREIGWVAIRAAQSRVFDEAVKLLMILLSATFVASSIAYLATYKLRRRMTVTRNQLEVSRSLLQQFVVNRETLLDEEHQRIAIEIHDQLGQVLTTALLNLRLLERRTDCNDQLTISLIKEIEEQLDGAYKGMKDIAASLHPVVMQFGLVASIEWLAERVFKSAGVNFQLVAPEETLSLDQRQAMTLFRITQEAFSNVVRHAKASSVWLSLVIMNERLILEILDSGVGFDPERRSQSLHFGLVGIKQRAELIGGSAEITSALGGGALIRVSIGYHKTPAETNGRQQ